MPRPRHRQSPPTATTSPATWPSSGSTAVDHYLGRYGSPESRAEYDRLIAEWLANGRAARCADPRPPPPGSSALTVTDLIAALLAVRRVALPRATASPPGNSGNIRDALQPVKQLYGHTPAAGFGPAAFKAVRAGHDRRPGCAGGRINWPGSARSAGCSSGASRPNWSPPTSTSGWPPWRRCGRAGTASARREPVKPVPDEHVEAVLPAPTPAGPGDGPGPAAHRRRPGEVIAMTAGQIDRGGELWVYTPGPPQDRTGRAGSGGSSSAPRPRRSSPPGSRRTPTPRCSRPGSWIEQHRAEKRAGRKSPHDPSQRAQAAEAVAAAGAERAVQPVLLHPRDPPGLPQGRRARLGPEPAPARRGIGDPAGVRPGGRPGHPRPRPGRRHPGLCRGRHAGRDGGHEEDRLSR